MGKSIQISTTKTMRDSKLREAARGYAETVKAQIDKRSQDIDGIKIRIVAMKENPD